MMHADQETLQAYLERQLAPQQGDAISQHLVQCDKCTRVFQEIQQLHRDLREGIDALEGPSPTETDAQRALQRFHRSFVATKPSFEETLSKPSSPIQPTISSWWDWLWSVGRGWQLGLTGALVLICFWGLPVLRTGKNGSHEILPRVAPGSPQKRSEPGLTMKNGVVRAAGLIAHKAVNPPFASSRPSSVQGMGTKYTHTHVLRDGDRVAPGDLLQFALQLPRDLYCLIVSINREGKPFVYLPLQKQQSRFFRAGEHLYPAKASMELDDTLGPERFFLFFATTPLPVSRIEAHLKDQFRRHDGDLKQMKTLLGPWVSKSFWILKVRTRPPSR